MRGVLLAGFTKTLLFLCGVILAACGGSSEEGGAAGAGTGSNGSGANGSSGAGPSGAPVSETQFREQAPDLLCQGVEACCIAAGLQYDPLLCQLWTTPAPVDPSLTYHAAEAGACLQQLRSMQCEATDMPSACDRVYSGTKQVGDACISDSECVLPAQGEAECDGFDNVCAIVRRGVLGDACTDSCRTFSTTGYICSIVENPQLGPYETVRCFREEGLLCGSDQTCQALAAVGEPCLSNEQCDDGNYCPYVAMNRVCAPQVAIGSECQPLSEDCVPGAHCTESGRCEADKPDGAPCVNFDECQGACNNSVCTAASDLGEGLLVLICGSQEGG